MEAADGQLLLLLSDADGKVLLRDTLRAPSKQYSAAIPRLPDLRLGLYAPVAAVGENGGITIAPGSDSPPLQMAVARLDTRGLEQISFPVRLRKEYCALTLRLENLSAPLSLLLQGAVSGFLPDGTPLPGPFSAEARPCASSPRPITKSPNGVPAFANASASVTPSSVSCCGNLSNPDTPNGASALANFSTTDTPSGATRYGSFSKSSPSGPTVYIIRIPRQLDDSLMLDIIIEGDEPAKTFAIGEILAGTGYDWSADILEDRTVTIDFARTRLSLSVETPPQPHIHEIVL